MNMKNIIAAIVAAGVVAAGVPVAIAPVAGAATTKTCPSGKKCGYKHPGAGKPRNTNPAHKH